MYILRNYYVIKGVLPQGETKDRHQQQIEE